MPRKSIIDNTTSCPHCGHRVLHQNLNDHIRRIHPDKEAEEQFTSSLKRTRSKEWWQKAADTRDVVPFSHIYSEVVGEPDPSRRRKAKAKTKKAKKLPKADSRPRCDICGSNVNPEDLEKHRAKHLYGQPYRSEEEIHCPICGLNIKHINLGNHIQIIHPNESKTWTKAARKQYLQDEYYGMNELRPVKMFFGTIMVTSRDWVKCPECGVMIRLRSITNHLRKSHQITA